jgi:hypothetical protein
MSSINRNERERVTLSHKEDIHSHLSIHIH